MRDDSDEDSTELFNLMSRMLQYDPRERISLCDALKHRFFDPLPTAQRLHLTLPIDTLSTARKSREVENTRRATCASDRSAADDVASPATSANASRMLMAELI